uniref:Uncharacterized protein n=1 Tax=Anguilla anguilla TaxID=7936 RepID=A0A0E9S7P3_ANGAN
MTVIATVWRTAFLFVYFLFNYT